MLMLMLAAVPGAASENDREQHGGSAQSDASQLDPHTAHVAGRLWGDLVCLCGRCQRLTLKACHCPDAANERRKVVDLLSGRDLASPAQEDLAYQAVMQDYIMRFGRKVLASERTGSGTSGDLPAFAISIGVIAAACIAVAVIEGRRRRRSPSRSRRRR
jgi:hypothetical protein